jgi:glycosyltransferase involved in cell wall biosynthesis
MKVKRFGVLICAHNEAEHIGSIVRLVNTLEPEVLLVVDDGSTDHTAALAQQAGAKVLRNRRNLGKGSSLKRGFKAMLEEQVEAVVVLDGDGQHDPNEIPRFLETYERFGIPILIGNRMADTKGMPRTRKWTNRFFAYVLNRLMKVYVADPPCGFRFYRADVLPFVMSSEQRFAFEFDVLLRAASRRIRIGSVRISTIYDPHQRSHVAPIRDAWLLAGVIRNHLERSRS